MSLKIPLFIANNGIFGVFLDKLLEICYNVFGDFRINVNLAE
jgi:hypothetical protein